MARRTVTALVLLGLLLPIVYVGGVPYFILIAAFVGMAAWEYSQMFSLRGFQPAPTLLIGAVLLILAGRAFWSEGAGTVLAAASLVLMGFHIIRFERGREAAAVDLAIDLGAVVYLGWVGAYLVDLRALSDGMWWLMLVLCTVWVADSSAYVVGVRIGRHKLSRRLSPKKTWEGYLGGIVAGTAAGALLGGLFDRVGPIDLAPWQGVGLGFLLSTLTTLGDLGESLVKRFAGMKDSGTILPGHGGAFDRIDSLIWAGALGYQWIRFVLMA